MRKFYSDLKKARARKSILKGVFEENLSIAGRRRSVRLRKRSHVGWKVFLSLTILMAFISRPVSSLSPPFFPENEIVATLMAAKAPPPVEEITVNPEYASFDSTDSLTMSRMLGLGVKTILIDAGHGGIDTGAIGNMGTNEKDLVLDIARRLQRRLEDHTKYLVLLTRNGDTSLTLNDRVEMSRSTKADLFISIHLNFLPNKPFNIIETYYFGPSRDAASVRLAKKENIGVEHNLSDFKALVEKMGTKLKLEESRSLASSIQKNLFEQSRADNEEILDYGVKRAPFAVLLGAEVPAVLVEVSCLSNMEEERRLQTVNHREDIARYLETGILDYLKKGEITYESRK